MVIVVRKAKRRHHLPTVPLTMIVVRGDTYGVFTRTAVRSTTGSANQYRWTVHHGHCCAKRQTAAQICQRYTYLHDRSRQAHDRAHGVFAQMTVPCTTGSHLRSPPVSMRYARRSSRNWDVFLANGALFMNKDWTYHTPHP